MKVVKRNGKFVEYERDKIRVAIGKANNEVIEKERATDSEIEMIMEYIESLGKKRILVEDIQDIIEEKLMEIGKYQLAKKYIVYRYTRALVRKQNTTDDSVLKLIRRTEGETTLSKDFLTVSKQRDLIAGEVSQDLTKRILLPDKIKTSEEEGILYFHDKDYFIQPIFDSSIIDIENMLEEGTVLNGELIESPNSFLESCIVLTQIIASIASSQYGSQSVDLSHFGKYLRKSYETEYQKLKEKWEKSFDEGLLKELVEDQIQAELTLGVQTIQYQINTLMSTNGHTPFVSLLLYLKEDDPYKKENAMIIKEILNQRLMGVKKEDGSYGSPLFPKLIYVLDENNCLKGGEFDEITNLAIRCSKKRQNPNYLSAKVMRKNYSGAVYSPMGRKFLTPWKDAYGRYKWDGRFHQGIVTINLPQIALLTKSEEEFFNLLEERLEICKDALLCKHYALLGTTSDVSPIDWQYGAISRLKKGEKIDTLLKDGYSVLSLGFFGLKEMTYAITKEEMDSQKGKTFAQKVLKSLKTACEKWGKETGVTFTLYGITKEEVLNRFLKMDQERFGVIEKVTEHYSVAYYREELENEASFELEEEFQNLVLGGPISYVNEGNLETLIPLIYEKIQYAEIKEKNEV